MPQPDSPTMPSVRPRATEKLTPSTARVRRPSVPGKTTRRSSTSRSGGAAHGKSALQGDGLVDLGVDEVAVGGADRVAAPRQEFAEVHPALAADLLQPLELGERIGVVVDAQVEVGVFLGRMDEQRGGLLAALVAARRLARPACAAIRRRAKGSALARIGLRRRLDHLRARPACCRRPRRCRGSGARTSRRRRCPVCAAKPPATSMTWSWRWALPASASVRCRDHLGGRHVPGAAGQGPRGP